MANPDKYSATTLEDVLDSLNSGDFSEAIRNWKGNSNIVELPMPLEQVGNKASNIVELPTPLEQVEHIPVDRQPYRPPLLRPGLYDLRIMRISLKTAMNNKNFISIVYRVVNGICEGRTVTDAIFPHSEKLGALLMAVNIDRTRIQRFLILDDFDEAITDMLIMMILVHNFRGYITTDERPLPDGTKRVFNRISAYYALNDPLVANQTETEAKTEAKTGTRIGRIIKRAHTRTIERGRSKEPDLADLTNAEEEKKV